MALPLPIRHSFAAAGVISLGSTDSAIIDVLYADRETAPDTP